MKSLRKGEGDMKRTASNCSVATASSWPASTGAFVLYVFVPLILMVLMGFKESNFIGFPITSWTLDWYTAIFADAEVVSTFAYSVAIAVCRP